LPADGDNGRVPATPSASPFLYGRARETEVLEGMLARGAERGDACVVLGEPGIGKSALLGIARDMALAKGYRVLTATGVQSEAELPFAGLHQMLLPLPWTADAVPGPQQEALLVAFGRSRLAAPDPFLIALATLELLADASSHSPLLVLADDAQWLDRPTSNVLTFVARRLQSDPIVMLFAVREGVGSALPEAGLREMRLSPLDDAEAAKLVDAQASKLTPHLREQILDQSRGNPLALVELPTVLQSQPAADVSNVPTSLPLTARLESAFTARFSELPETTRAVLLIAALDDRSDLAEVLSAASSLRNEVVAPDAIAPAEAARLVEVTGGQLHFRHPLVRSAIQQGATLSSRMAAHAALADALEYEPERRAWHRASSVVGRNEAVAEELARVAEAARARGARVVSVNALRRSAELSPDPARRLDRLLRAAETAFEVGRRDIVAAIVEQAEPLMPLGEGPLARGRMALVGGLGGSRVLQPERITSLVAIAEEARAAGDTNLAWNLLWRIAQRCFWADPGPDARHVVVRAADAAAAAEDDARRVAILAYAAPLECANSVIDSISHWPLETLGAEDARLLGSAAVVVGAFEMSVPLLHASVAGLRAQGRLAQLARALTMQGWSALCLADWRVAIPALDEAVRMATETGEAAWAAGARAMQAIIAAMRGQPDAATALSMEAEGAALATGATHMLAYIHVARSLAALGAGRADDAYQELVHIYDAADPAHHMVPSCWYVGELAEAAMHGNRRDEARVLIRELEPMVEGSRSPWIRSAFTYARAQLADDAEFEQRVREALSQAQASRWPFQRARLQLSYGTWLRRQRRISDARAVLRSARDVFDSIGTPEWAERARQELRAAGETSQGRIPDVWDQLSPQELQIASMAAEGLSNREIAERLYLSPRTVGSHLYRLFPKLGITSRAQLSNALARPAS
jgi:DNA-binding CsgD family transcriptional regulator